LVKGSPTGSTTIVLTPGCFPAPPVSLGFPPLPPVSPSSSPPVLCRVKSEFVQGRFSPKSSAPPLDERSFFSPSYNSLPPFPRRSLFRRARRELSCLLSLAPLKHASLLLYSVFVFSLYVSLSPPPFPPSFRAFLPLFFWKPAVQSYFLKRSISARLSHNADDFPRH